MLDLPLVPLLVLLSLDRDMVTVMALAMAFNPTTVPLRLPIVLLSVATAPLRLLFTVPLSVATVFLRLLSCRLSSPTMSPSTDMDLKATSLHVVLLTSVMDLSQSLRLKNPKRLLFRKRPKKRSKRRSKLRKRPKRLRRRKKKKMKKKKSRRRPRKRRKKRMR